jgi:hypothetical protein
MQCLRSFTFASKEATTFSGSDIDVWSIGLENYWAVMKAGTSTFSIEGFKNIEVYGITATGEVFCSIGSNRSVIVNNWAFTVQINGTVPLINGFVGTTNDFFIQPQDSTPLIQIGRYYPKIEYQNPITSVKSIEIKILRASGVFAEDPTLINLNWNVNFVVKYLYEGESNEFALL